MAWEQLIDIAQEAAQYRRDEETQPPEACPNDGEPLQKGSDGQLFCPYDGWRP